MDYALLVGYNDTIRKKNYNMLLCIWHACIDNNLSNWLQIQKFYAFFSLLVVLLIFKD